MPDDKVFALAIHKRYARLEAEADYSLRGELKAVANSLLEASHVGAMQALMAILGLPFVQCPRVWVRLNTLPENEVSRQIKQGHELRVLRGEESAIDLSPATQLGRRSAYHKLVRHQWQNFSMCDVTFYHVMSYYHITEQRQPQGNSRSCQDAARENTEEAASVQEPTMLSETDAAENAKVGKDDLVDLLQMNPDGSPHQDSPKKFTLPNTNLMFSLLTEPTEQQSIFKNKRPRIVELSPYIPVNPDDERFCYSALLLHYPWPFEGEAALLNYPEDDTTSTVDNEDDLNMAVGNDMPDAPHADNDADDASVSAADGHNAPRRLPAVAMYRKRLPDMHAYAKICIGATRHSQDMLANNGTPTTHADDEDGASRENITLGDENLGDSDDEGGHLPASTNEPRPSAVDMDRSCLQKVKENLSAGDYKLTSEFIHHAHIEHQQAVRFKSTALSQ